MSLLIMPPPLPAPGLPHSLLWQKTDTIVSPTLERLQHQQGRGLKLAAVVLTLDSALQRKERIVFPCLHPDWGWTLAESFPSFEAVWVFVFPVAMSSGARGLLEVKAD